MSFNFLNPMVQEFSYSFDELPFDLLYLSSILGFPEGTLPEPFDGFVSQGIELAQSLCNIKGAFCFTSKSEFSDANSQLVVDGISFGVGKTVAKELRNSESVAFYICTAGEEISQCSHDLLKGDNPVLGYILDVLGSMIVNAATDELQKEIKQIVQSKGYSITNRYSPGYCKWSVADQHKLFSFFPENCCGIRLTDSSLMHPVKSTSGLIGIGKEVKFRQYTCDLCSQENCFHKSYQRSI